MVGRAAPAPHLDRGNGRYRADLAHSGLDIRALDVPTGVLSIEQRLVQTMGGWVGQAQCLLNRKS